MTDTTDAMKELLAILAIPPQNRATDEDVERLCAVMKRVETDYSLPELLMTLEDATGVEWVEVCNSKATD